MYDPHDACVRQELHQFNSRCVVKGREEWVLLSSSLQQKGQAPGNRVRTWPLDGSGGGLPWAQQSPNSPALLRHCESFELASSHSSRSCLGTGPRRMRADCLVLSEREANWDGESPRKSRRPHYCCSDSDGFGYRLGPLADD